MAAPTHLLEVRGRLHLAHGLHQGVPHDDADVGPRVAVSLAGELLDVGICQGVWGVPQVQPEHLGPRRLLGQGDVDPLLEPGGMRGEPQFQPCRGAGTGGCMWGSPSPDGRVQHPGDVGGTQHQDPVTAVSHTCRQMAQSNLQGFCEPPGSACLVLLPPIPGRAPTHLASAPGTRS